MDRRVSIKKDESSSTSFELLNKYLKSANQEHYKAIMYAALIVAGIVAFIAICLPFFGPLIWAFLIGAFIFPMKRSLATVLNDWFDDLERSNKNIFIALTLTPIQINESYGKVLVDWIKKYRNIIFTVIGVVLFSKLFLSVVPRGFFCALLKLAVFGHSIIDGILLYVNIFQLIVAIVLYVSAIVFFWKDETRTYFIVSGQSLWIIIIAYFCSFLGPLQVPALIFISTCILFAMIYNLRKTGGIELFSKLLEKNSYLQAIKAVYIEEKTDNVSSENEVKSGNENLELATTFYLRYLFYACCCTFLYKNTLTFFLATIPISVHLIQRFGDSLGIWNIISNKYYDISTKIQNWSLEHHSAILPLCLPGILEINFIVQLYIRRTLKSSIDLVTSIMIILLMIFAISFISVFFCVNIYSETIEVAYLGKDLINRTITDRPELMNILPDNFRSSIDDALDNAHHFGRRKIEQYIDDFLENVDPEHGSKLKIQILTVWDRLIQYWMDMSKSDSIGPRIPAEAFTVTLEDIVDNPVAKQGIIGWAKSNTNTILEVTESVWRIIHSNISMILGATGEIFSLLLSGGQACIEFFVDMIVFFTALFYLISTSGPKYAPLQIGSYLGVSSSSKISETLENSIASVLIAMFKCSLFQGLFAWLALTIFGARIIYLPSLLAFILSAVPFLGTYWVAIPAFLELWLAQDRLYSGILLMALMFFIPPYFEGEVYEEMKGGGHPYLTGLAIAGGTYWLGCQGSIFGPLILCIFVGIFKIITSKLKSEETNDVENLELENKIAIESEGNTESQTVCMFLVTETISTTLPDNPVPLRTFVQRINLFSRRRDENVAE